MNTSGKSITISHDGRKTNNENNDTALFGENLGRLPTAGRQRAVLRT